MSKAVRRPPRSGLTHPVDRWHRILERVAAEQTIHVADLAAELGVSEMTIRRDIRRLERDGFLRQTYGGATAHVTRSFEVSFNARALEHPREKRLIGIRAVQELSNAGTAYLGIGTTAEQVARYLSARPSLHIVTPSLPIASLLGTRPLQVTVLGGTVLLNELDCVGPIALRTLERFRFDVAIVGAAGLSARWGITEIRDEEAEIARTAIERADRLVVIADGSKLGRATPIVVVPADRIDVLITDDSAPAKEVDLLRALHVDVVLVGPGHEARLEPAIPEPAGQTRPLAGTSLKRKEN